MSHPGFHTNKQLLFHKLVRLDDVCRKRLLVFYINIYIYVY